ncbi:MAG: hypothetical protein RMM17_06825 [Acidobacteriota bacterium]|nr:hypothetical protein [Blastocatellia bacterium]MDW8412377.1 hypothetical protein [Acidobacteriota bacterium]
MDESLEKAFKELLQKKLKGMLTPEEELILNDLAVRRQRSSRLANLPVSNSRFDEMVRSMESLSSDFDEMAEKIRRRSSIAESKKDL